MNLLDKLKGVLPLPGSIRHQLPSYSQSGEDRILAFIFRSLGINRPSYLDIGAHHPQFLNNTYVFYRQGGRGINIEPDPILFSAIAKSRPKDVNLQIGIGPEKGEQPFYLMNPPTLNTFSESEARKYCEESRHSIDKIIKVHVNTISNVIGEHCKGAFPNLLTLDAEGMDEVILDSIEFSKSKPLVICVETLEYARKTAPQKNLVIAEKLSCHGYFVYADTYINTIFVLRDQWEGRKRF